MPVSFCLTVCVSSCETIFCRVDDAIAAVAQESWLTIYDYTLSCITAVADHYGSPCPSAHYYVLLERHGTMAYHTLVYILCITGMEENYTLLYVL